MKPIKFSREETAAIAAKLRPYFRDELDVELRDLQAQMLIDFLSSEIGPFFYNRALLRRSGGAEEKGRRHL